MDIIEFWNQTLVRNAYLDEPEFEALYCRKGPMYLPVPPEGKLIKMEPLLQIANLTAKKPQTGAFTRLVGKINRELKCNIFVENVFNPGFARGLMRMGFLWLDFPVEGPPCFLKLRE